MFARPIHELPSHTRESARAAYEREVDRLTFLTEQHEHQRQRAEAAARQAALAAYVEEEGRRQRQLAFELAVQREVERRRRQQQEALLVQQALAAHRAQQEREAVFRRQAIVEAAQRRAVLVAREQHRRRLEAEREQRRRAVEARRQQRSRQLELPHALFQLFLDLAPSASQQQDHASVNKSAEAREPTSAKDVAPEPALAKDVPSETTLPDPAIETLQGRFERDVARQSALDTLNGLTAEFESRLAAFTSPATLTFQTPPSNTPASPSHVTTPPLAYGKPNSAFLGHEDFLVSLLSRVDAVSSGGDKAVKQARKALVQRVEIELAKLDALKEYEWERQSQRASSEAGEPQVANLQEKAEAVEASKIDADSTRTNTVAPLTSSDTAKTDALSSPALVVPTPGPTSPGSDEQYPTAPNVPADHPIAPLTAESLATLPSSTTTAAAAATPRPRSRTSTTSLASEASSAVDRYVQEMLRRAKQLSQRVDAEEGAERAALSASATSDITTETSVDSWTPSATDTAAIDDDVSTPAKVRLSSPEPIKVEPESTEPLEDGVDEEIDVEATLRRNRSLQSVTANVQDPVAAQTETEYDVEQGTEAKEHENTAPGNVDDAASEAGTEEFLVV